MDRFGIGGVRIVGSSTLDVECMVLVLVLVLVLLLLLLLLVVAVLLVLVKEFSSDEKYDRVVNVSLNPAKVISNPECNPANQISRSELVCALQYICVPALVRRRNVGGVFAFVGDVD